MCCSDSSDQSPVEVTRPNQSVGTRRLRRRPRETGVAGYLPFLYSGFRFVEAATQPLVELPQLVLLRHQYAAIEWSGPQALLIEFTSRAVLLDDEHGQGPDLLDCVTVRIAGDCRQQPFDDQVDRFGPFWHDPYAANVVGVRDDIKAGRYGHEYEASIPLLIRGPFERRQRRFAVHGPGRGVVRYAAIALVAVESRLPVWQVRVVENGLGVYRHDLAELGMDSGAVIALGEVLPVNLPVAVDRVNLLVHRTQFLERPVRDEVFFIAQKICQVPGGCIAQVDEYETPPRVGVNPVQRVAGGIEITRFNPSRCGQQLAVDRKSPGVIRADNPPVAEASVGVRAKPGASMWTGVVPGPNLTVRRSGHDDALVSDRRGEVITGLLQRVDVADAYPVPVPDLLELQSVMIGVVVPACRQRRPNLLQCSRHVCGLPILGNTICHILAP
jgi:hypothetical protein